MDAGRWEQEIDMEEAKEEVEPISFGALYDMLKKYGFLSTLEGYRNPSTDFQQVIWDSFTLKSNSNHSDIKAAMWKATRI